MTTYSETPKTATSRDIDTQDLISRLTPQQRALLDLLAAGNTIAKAAEAAFLSLRTANRRIAKARALFGVWTTRDAVLAYQRQTSPRPTQPAR